MGKKITLVLNLGDEQGGPAEEIVKGRSWRQQSARDQLKGQIGQADKLRLRLVADTEIKYVDAIGPFLDYLAGRKNSGAFKQLGQVICDATKIVIVAHGGVVDTDALAYKRSDGSTTEIKVIQLAGFLKALISKPKKDRFFALMACYGARVPGRKDQQSVNGVRDLASSLSYKLVKELATSLHAFTVSARTGKVSVMNAGGVVVSSDAAAGLDEEFTNFVLSDSYQRAKKIFSDRFDSLGELPKRRPDSAKSKADELRILMEDIDHETGGWRFLDANDLEVAKAYYSMRMRATKMEAHSDESKQKFGKLIYRFDNRRLTILNRYADGGAKVLIQSAVRNKDYDGLQLYSGPLF